MILNILKHPDPVLKKVSIPIKEITPEIVELSVNMLETMYDAKGVGLAAPQVGKNIRLIVLDPQLEGAGLNPEVIVNPEWESDGDLIVSKKEGCLSVPLNFRSDVPRYEKIRVRGLNIKGEVFEKELDGLAAIIVQHETDHLNGNLFIDRISHLKRALYEKKLRKWIKNQNQE